MRQFLALFMLIACAPLFAQEDCHLFNLQELSDAYQELFDAYQELSDAYQELSDADLTFQVDTIIKLSDGIYEVHLSNGTTFMQVQGCTNSTYLEYNAAANTDDGSCSTLLGCTDSAYLEYNAAAGSDDGSCSTLLGCTDSAYLEYNAAAGSDDGSCTTLVVEGCTDPDYEEFDASANTDDGSCATYACISIEFDGYTYSLVNIGDQCWFAENLRTTVYANGSAIPEVTDNGAWMDSSTGARCDYDNDASNVATYGRMYNWHAVDDARGLCPTGWYVPTDVEWTELEDYLGLNGHSGAEGTALKSTSGWNTYAWTGTSGNGTDDFGFSVLPGGYRPSWNGSFYESGGVAYFWSSSWYGGGGAWASSSEDDEDDTGAWSRMFFSTFNQIGRDHFNPQFGLSVRCRRDVTEVQGCTDPAYDEYDSEANTDDGSCSSLLGCMDPAYDEYNFEAMTDDGSCATISGCTDPAYDEYDPAANTDDGSCATMPGCTDPTYTEYNSEATIDDGSCATEVVEGCTDPAFAEYSHSANTDDGSCQNLLGCTDSDAASMDGYSYSLTTIGDQCWFAENLRTTVYANGSAIPEVTDDGAWSELSTGAHCVYNNDANNLATYSRLYNWYAVNNGSGLCPSGWHVPTDGEWTELEEYLGLNGHSGAEGTALKSTSGWNGTDDFGFSALPGGERSYGYFDFAVFSGSWWSSSLGPNGDDAWLMNLMSWNPSISRYSMPLRSGFSVRCLRDADHTESQGCTDPSYLEFDASANVEDGSCTTLVVEGCTNPTADNYDASANTDDGSCIYYGCTDPGYTEYNAAANTDDGSCATMPGCTDPTYTEYNSEATIDDGSCATEVVEGCTDPAFAEYSHSANTDDGSCQNLLGCTDSDAASMDGYSYSLTTIGDQCWFAENLRTTVYANGSAIPEVTDDGAWSELSTGAHCVYNNDANNLATYSRLYNWYAVNNGSGLCPSGWHVPTDGEWTELEEYLGLNGHSGAEGTALKSTSGWNGTDDFGFSALPGGERSYGYFDFAVFSGSWWSSSLGPNGDDAWLMNLMSWNPSISRYSMPLRSGFSVRCLRDADHTESQGCTDPSYLEFDASANVEDGSCTTLVVEGCTNPTADNYDASANTDDGSCIYYGCTDPGYTEYNAAANTDDGSCATMPGCTDPTYTEYNSEATIDDGSCTTEVVEGCTDPAFAEYSHSANTDDGSCQNLLGCTDSDAPSMDGYSYSLTTIGDQCWFAENLRTTVYANGSAIPEVTDDGAWSELSTGAHCVYNNDANNLATYGRLYNWYAVNNGSGLCPSGWHVPTDGEWTELQDYLSATEHSGAEGTALKSTSGWNGTDDFGFSALPGGERSYGYFDFAVFSGSWWSSSLGPNGDDAWLMNLMSWNPSISRYSMPLRSGFSVRCLRDAD